VVNVGKSDAAYQGFQVADLFGQTLPYATRQTSLNATQAQAASDGRLYFVLSAEDPGVPNWIDIEGSPQGLLFLRWQGLPAPLPASANPTAQLVPLASVRDALPSDTPTVSSAARDKQLDQRNRAVARRVRTSSNEAAALLTGYLRQVANEVGRNRVLGLYGDSTLRSALRGKS